TELASDVVHVRLDREGALGVAGRAHEAAGELVRVDEARIDAHVGHAVGPGSVRCAAERPQGLEGRAGTGIDKILDLVRDECAGTLYAGLERRDCVMAWVAGAELLDVITDDLHGATGGLREVVSDGRVT